VYDYMASVIDDRGQQYININISSLSKSNADAIVFTISVQITPDYQKFSQIEILKIVKHPFIEEAEITTIFHNFDAHTWIADLVNDVFADYVIPKMVSHSFWKLCAHEILCKIIPDEVSRYILNCII